MCPVVKDLVHSDEPEDSMLPKWKPPSAWALSVLQTPSQEPHFTTGRGTNVPYLSLTCAKLEWHSSKLQRSTRSLWFFWNVAVCGFYSAEIAWAYGTLECNKDPRSCVLWLALFAQSHFGSSLKQGPDLLSWVPWSGGGGLLTNTNWNKNWSETADTDTVASRFRANCCIMFRMKLVHEASFTSFNEEQ